jgi:hypothetical protein
MTHPRRNCVYFSSRGRFGECDSKDVSIQLQCHGTEVASDAVRKSGHGVKTWNHRGQINCRHLSEVSERTDHNTRKGEVPTDQQFCQCLIGCACLG